MKRTLAVMASLAMALMSIFAVAGPASAQDYVPNGPVQVVSGSIVAGGFSPGQSVMLQQVDANGNNVGDPVTVVADANGVISFSASAGVAFIRGVGATNFPQIAVAAPAAAPAAPAPSVPAPAAPVVTAPVAVTLAQSPSLQGVPAAPARPALALTGGETLTPVLIGTALIAVGGMALVSSKRRESVVS